MNIAEMVAKHKLSTEHTGGGCMAYEYIFPDDSYILVTNEVNLPQDGERIQVGYTDSDSTGESYLCFDSPDNASIYLDRIIPYVANRVANGLPMLQLALDAGSILQLDYPPRHVGYHLQSECKDKCFGWNFDTCQCEYGVDGQCWNSPVNPAAFCEDCMSGEEGEDPPCNGLHDAPISDEERSNGPVRR